MIQQLEGCVTIPPLFEEQFDSSQLALQWHLAAIEPYLYGSHAHFILRIQDSGRGIPKNEHEFFFDKFYRGTNAHDIPGSGLGLSVLKKIVEMHSGKIDIASQIGIGSTFTIYLPQ